MAWSRRKYYACQLCRMKRSKCDGQTPCSRCQLWDTECIFEDRDKETKSQLRQIRDDLLQQEKDFDTIISALKSEKHAHRAIQSLWRREGLTKIATDFNTGSWIQGDSDASAPSSTLTASDSNLLTTPDHSLASNFGVIHGPSTAPTPIPLPEASATDRRKHIDVVRKDGPARAAELAFEMAQSHWDLDVLGAEDLQELLRIFFDAQCIPLFTIDRQLFTDDLLANRNENCSPALLRAILALACRIVGGYDSLESYHVNLGDRMFHESRALLAAGGPTRLSLPNAQALGLLALHQIARYDLQDTLDLIEEGVYILGVLCGHIDGTHSPASSPTTLIAECYQGAMAIARIARLACSCINPPSIDGTRQQVSTLRAPMTEISKLLEVSGTAGTLNDLDLLENTFVHVIDEVYISSLDHTREKGNHPEGIKDLLQTYKTCLDWYAYITGALVIDSLDRSVVIFTHLVYHFCLMSLFRPYSDSNTSETSIDLKKIREESASAVIALCTTFHELVPQQSWPCFLPLFVYAAGEVLAPKRVKPELTTSNSLESTNTRGSRSTVSRTQSTSAGSLTTPSTDATTPMVMNDNPPISSATSDMTTPDELGKPPMETFGIGEALTCLSKMKKIFPAARLTECWLSQIRDSGGTLGE